MAVVAAARPGAGAVLPAGKKTGRVALASVANKVTAQVITQRSSTEWPPVDFQFDGVERYHAPRGWRKAYFGDIPPEMEKENQLLEKNLWFDRHQTHWKIWHLAMNKWLNACLPGTGRQRTGPWGHGVFHWGSHGIKNSGTPRNQYWPAQFGKYHTYIFATQFWPLAILLFAFLEGSGTPWWNYYFWYWEDFYAKAA